MGNLSGFVKRLRDIMRNDAAINGDAQRIEQITWLLFLKVYDAKEQDWQFDDESYQSIIPEECRWSSWAADDRSGRAMTGGELLDFVNNTLFPTLKKLPVDASAPIKKAIVQSTFICTLISCLYLNFSIICKEYLKDKRCVSLKKYTSLSAILIVSR